MGYRQTEFAPDEWYHCYTRSISGRDTFTDARDYERFKEALYLCNSATSTPRANLKRASHEEILLTSRSGLLVSVGVYCIMPNHFHLLLREEQEGGISKFMQRLGTSYAKYFNTKYKQIGNVFVKPFRAKYIDGDVYLKRVAEYIHLNPVELFEGEWKIGNAKNMKELNAKLCAYAHSSLPDFLGRERFESKILNLETMDVLKSAEENLSTYELLRERTEYYRDLNRV